MALPFRCCYLYEMEINVRMIKTDLAYCREQIAQML